MSSLRFADIAVNLTDPQYTGVYHGKSKHSSDLDAVVARAKARGVEKILITGTSLQESREALALARKYELHSTAGCHPTSTSEIDKHPEGVDGYIRDLRALIEEDRGEGGSRRIISIGEAHFCVDYDRLHFSDRETQLKHLADLLRLSKTYSLPLFLHSRTSESQRDLIRILGDVGWNKADWPGGVVHSFTGTREEADEWVAMGMYVGINGCSLKTEENVEMVKHLPLESLTLETDAPWCSITTTHASHKFLPKDITNALPRVSKPDKWKEDHGVKGRNEPCDVELIALVVAGIKGISVEEVAEAAWQNSLKLFYPDEA